MKLLYKSLVRPHLEYGAAIFSPYWHYGIDKLEAVQRRATRIETLRGCSYEERLRKSNLPTLMLRRRRGHLIQMFKIVKGKDNFNYHYQPQKFELDLGRGRHDERIRMQLTKLRIRNHFFTNRVANDWNSLTQEIIDKDNINLFKNSIDKHFSF